MSEPKTTDHGEEWWTDAGSEGEVVDGSVEDFLARAGGAKPMSESFIENYKAKHRHPLNKLTHSIGIPMIVISLPLFLFNWRWALGLFIIGWVLQFAGHLIEGNQPAFFRNPVYLLVGPWWLLRRAAASLGLIKTSPAK